MPPPLPCRSFVLTTNPAGVQLVMTDGAIDEWSSGKNFRVCSSGKSDFKSGFGRHLAGPARRRRSPENLGEWRAGVSFLATTPNFSPSRGIRSKVAVKVACRDQ